MAALVERYGLKGVVMDEVAGGAVVTHTRHWNIAREATLARALRRLPWPRPAARLRHLLQAAGMIANKIAPGQIESGIAMRADTASTRRSSRRGLATRLRSDLPRAKSLGQAERALLKASLPGEL